MKISITAKAILDDKLGKLTKDQVVDLPDHKANFYLNRGEAVQYQTKVVYQAPAPTVSVDKPKGRKTLKSLLSQTPELE